MTAKTFNEVELTRQIFIAKSKATAKKRQKIIIIAGLIVLAVDLLILALSAPRIGQILSSDAIVPPILVIVVPALVIIVLEVFFILVGAYFATGGNNATSEYLDYKHAYKSYFISRQLTALFTDIDYRHNQGISQQLLADTGLIYVGARYHSNDFVQGKYRQIGFAQADVHIESKREEEDQNGHVETHYVTVFKGRYLIFEFPKKFDFKMVVSFNGYSLAYFNPKTGRGLVRVETESPEFNKRFLVYAEDGFEAFYILTPTIIEKLEKLGQKYHNQLALYFSDHKLYIGLNDGGDAFEPPNPALPLDEAAETAKVINDMQLIIEIVDNLVLAK